MKQSADNNFEFDVNRKLSKLVENTVGKGEIAHEWGLLVFCKQTPLQLGTIGTLIKNIMQKKDNKNFNSEKKIYIL